MRRTGRRSLGKRGRRLLTIMFELRPYQQEALSALETYWSQGGGNPLVTMATATGKSVIIAYLIRDISRRYPTLRVLVVTHVLELIRQDLDHLLALWPEAPIGINCAALAGANGTSRSSLPRSRRVWRVAARLGSRDLVLIDECASGAARRRRHVPQPAADAARLATATCGWLGSRRRRSGSISGRLDEGDGKIFDEVVFDYGIGEGIRDGWLSPLSSQGDQDRRSTSAASAAVAANSSPASSRRAADDDTIINAACDEIVTLGADRRCLAGLLLRHRSRAPRARRATRCAACLRGGLRRDAAGRARGHHRCVQGRHDPLPGQRHGADDRLRRAAGSTCW